VGESVDVALENMQRYEGRTLVRVNGEEITWEEYEPAFERALQNVTREYGLDWSDNAMKQRLAHFQDDVLQAMIDQVLIRQMAERAGVSVSEAEVDERLQSEKERILSGGQSLDWDAFLEMSGHTDETFRRFLYERLLLEALLATQDVETSIEHVHVSHIFVREEAMAEAIMAELEAGRDFGDLASQYSEDTSTRDQGGEVGWVPRGGMDPEAEAVVWALEVGEYTEPIETAGGYSIVLLMGREWRDLDPQLIQQKQSEAMKASLEEQRANAQIEYLIDFVAASSG
jgi:parvulin-like peptidyl-prolyl isomerase